MPVMKGSKRPARGACRGWLREVIRKTSSAGKCHWGILGSPVCDSELVSTAIVAGEPLRANPRPSQGRQRVSFFQKVQLLGSQGLREIRRHPLVKLLLDDRDPLERLVHPVRIS